MAACWAVISIISAPACCMRGPPSARRCRSGWVSRNRRITGAANSSPLGSNALNNMPRRGDIAIPGFRSSIFGFRRLRHHVPPRSFVLVCHEPRNRASVHQVGNRISQIRSPAVRLLGERLNPDGGTARLVEKFLSTCTRRFAFRQPPRAEEVAFGCAQRLV